MSRLLTFLSIMLISTIGRAASLLQTPPPPPPDPNSPGPGSPDVPVDNIVIFLAVLAVGIIAYFVAKARLQTK